MKKIFIILISVVILVVGVFYLALSDIAKINNQAANRSKQKDGSFSGQTKISSPQPLLRQSPSARTRTS